METEARPATWKILLAFSMIYFVWGSTFLAIRVGVHEVPPFLLAAVRFFTAGLVMYAWLRLKGTPAPVPREWMAASALGALIFVVDYGCLFWAEQRVPSGIAAVVLATIPVFITLMEIIFLRTQRLTVRLSLALIIGLFGVAVLMNHSFSFGEVPVNRAGAIALLVASATWSIATVYTSRLPLPASKPMSAAAQMLTGGAHVVRPHGGDRGVYGLPRAGSFGARMVRAGLSHHRWFNYWIHRLRLAAALRVADEGGNLRICQSGGRGRFGIFFRRGSGWSQDFAGNFAGVGERRYDYDDAKGWAG